MHKPVKILLLCGTLFLFSAFALPQQVLAATGFQLDNTVGATSHIYWPFSESHGKGGTWEYTGKSDYHTGGDVNAQDWNLKGAADGGQADCGLPFYAPLTGEVIYAGDPKNGYGFNVVILSDTNSQFALRIAHLESNLPVKAGDKVGTTTRLGAINMTGGTSTGCHAHIALYRNLDQAQIAVLKEGGKPASEAFSALFSLEATSIPSCNDGWYRAQYFNKKNFTQEVLSRCEYEINNNWNVGKPHYAVKANNFSVRWQGKIPFRAGDYRFIGSGVDGLKVWLNGSLIINHTQTDATFNVRSKKLKLTNLAYPIRVDYVEKTGPAGISLKPKLVLVRNTAPTIINLADQTAAQGQSIVINLNDHVSDPDIGEKFVWTITGANNLKVVKDADNKTTITTKLANWAGSETLTFTVRDLYSGTASKAVKFTFSSSGSSCNYNVGDSDETGLVNAINAANSNADKSTICLPHGSLYTFDVIDNETNGQNYLPVITTPIEIRGDASTLSNTQGPENKARYFTIKPGGKLTVNMLNVRYGYEDDGEGGGAILNDGGEFTVQTSSFWENRTTSQGAVIMNRSGGKVVLTEGHFRDNRATNLGTGGAIANIGSNSTTYMTGSGFLRNEAGNGGAVYIGSGAVTILDTKLSQNVAINNGGAIYAFGGQLTVSESEFLNNETESFQEGMGGAIMARESSSLEIINTLFSSNKASVQGDAIHNMGNAIMTGSCIEEHISATKFALSNDPLAPNFSAKNNWWGNAAGPGNPYNKVSTNVTYTPFLTTRPSCGFL